MALVLATVSGPGLAFTAQDDPAESEEEASSPVVRDEVELRIAKLGPGGRTRAGSWGGVLVEYRDSALSQREIVLRLGGLDRDGDPPSYERTVVGDPERARSVWLYAPMPYPSQIGRLSVSAHEAIETEGGFRAGRVLGRAVIDTTALVQGESAMIGVIGTRDAGLRQYGVAIVGPIRHTPLGNAATEVVTGLNLRDIPDRWQGLAPYSVLVWSRGGADTDPNALDADRARAIREWVTRGGHLVVLLPPVGQTWTAGAGRNPLSDLLPAVRVERREGVSLEPYRPLLADSAVLNAINNGEVKPDGFLWNGPACALKPAARKALIAAYERRLAQETTHPLFGYRLSMRRLVEVQVRLLARHLDGEIRDYPHYMPR